MAYPALDPDKYGAGTPLDIADVKKLYEGDGRTNGVLMRDVDGRVPALKTAWSNIIIGPANPLFVPGNVAWGNGFWRDITQIDTKGATLYTEKPAKGIFAGVLMFNQGIQTGNPVVNWGLPRYSKGTLIVKGPVRYKVAMAAAGDSAVAANYLKLLQGDTTQDVAAVRTTYEEWVAIYKAGGDGDKLGLFFDNLTGFPVVALVSKASLGAPALTGATFAGFATVFEKEVKCIYFDVNA